MYKTLLLATALCLSVGTAKAITLVPGPVALSSTGEISGNDDAGDLESILAGIDASFSVSLNQTKHDSPSSGSTGGLVVSVDGGGLSGSWAYTGDESIYAYVVKGGPIFKVYYYEVGGVILPIPTVAPGVNTFYEYAWDTTGLTVGGGNNPALSHSSVYGGPGGTTEVPEPMTLALTGGLIGGLAFLRRRK